MFFHNFLIDLIFFSILLKVTTRNLLSFTLPHTTLRCTDTAIQCCQIIVSLCLYNIFFSRLTEVSAILVCIMSLMTIKLMMILLLNLSQITQKQNTGGNHYFGCIYNYFTAQLAEAIPNLTALSITFQSDACLSNWQLTCRSFYHRSMVKKQFPTSYQSTLSIAVNMCNNF